MPLPTWVPDPGFLKNVPSDDGTLDSLTDVDPALSVGTYGSLAAALKAWNSAVLCEDAGTMGVYVLAPGGHTDWAGNAWFAFDLATRKWSVLSSCTSTALLTKSGNESAWADSKARYSDGKVGSFHTYGNFVAIPASIDYPQGQVIIPGGSYAGWAAGVTTKYAHAIDVATGAQRASSAAATHGGEPNGSGCYDPVRDVVWVFGTQSGTGQVQRLNPYALTWGSVEYITETYREWRFYVLSCYHPPSDLIVQRVAYGATNSIFLFNPATVARTEATTSGTGPSATEGAGFEYCPLDGCFYAYVPGQTKVFKLTPPASAWASGTWAWSTENFDAGSDTVAYGTYSGTEINRFQRWRWVPGAESFFWLDTVSQQPQFYRPASAASSGGGGGGATTSGGMLLCYPNVVDGATVSGGDWGATLDNILTRDLGEVAESASLATADTRFTLDLGSSQYVRAVAILGHTMSAAGVLQIDFGTTSGGAESGSSGLVDAWQMSFDDRMRRMPDADPLVGSPFHVVYVHATEIACRYITVMLSDATNAAGVLRVGRVFAGPAMEEYMDIGATFDWADLSTVERTLGGRILYQQRRRYRVAEIPLSHIDETARGQIIEARRGAGVHGEVLIVPDSLDPAAQQEFGFVGRWRDLGQMPWSMPLRFKTTLSLEELL